MALVDHDTCLAGGVDPRAAAVRAARLGADVVALRARRLDGPSFRAWAEAVADEVRGAGARLVAAGAAPGHGLGVVDGVHLADDGARPEAIRERWPQGASVSISAHDARSVDLAADADWATLSPVRPVAARPGYGPVLGPEGFAELARAARTPLLALGGIAPGDVAALAEAGAHGVAALSGFCTRDASAARALIGAARDVWGAR